MKYILSLTTFFLLASFRPPGNIYSFTIKTIDGNTIELSQFKGKKLLFILLPISVQDSTVSVDQIGRLQTKYQGSLVIVGVPAVEAGYKTQDTGKLKKIYSDEAANIMITEGMKVKKGNGQVSLFQWLTDKSENRHFNQDVEWTVGSKFFVDETGELYAVMGPQLSLKSPLIDKIIGRTPIGK
jgi:glutathione peroxidase